MMKNQNEPPRPLIQERKMSSFRDINWHRAYRDWRVLIAVLVLLVILVTYLMTGDLTWHPRGPWRQDVEKSDKYGTDLPPVTRP
jgi:hypothetical protein